MHTSSLGTNPHNSVNTEIIRSGSLCREEHYLRVSEIEMLWNVSGIKDEENSRKMEKII